MEELESYSINELREVIKSFVTIYYARAFLQADCGLECSTCNPFKVLECLIDNKENIKEFLQNQGKEKLQPQKKEELMGNQERWALLKKCREAGLIPEGVDGRRLNIHKLQDLIDNKISPGDLAAKDEKKRDNVDSQEERKPIYLPPVEGAEGITDSTPVSKIARILEDLHELIAEDHKEIKHFLAQILVSTKAVSTPQKSDEGEKVEDKGPRILLDNGSEVVVSELSRDSLIKQLTDYDKSIKWADKSTDELREELLESARESGYTVEE